MKTLPIGDQTFEGIIKNKSVFVDKTEFLYNLIKPGRGRYFLSRPRRFGKSTTCSILEAILQGRKELFKGLWIEKADYHWKPVPVVRIDFSGIRHMNADDLMQNLTTRMQSIADNFKIKLSQKTVAEDALRTIILTLAKKHGAVAVLVDEYDKPITDHIDNPEMAKAMRDVLKSFYNTFKEEKVDAAIPFLFITGVSKFSKVTVFSGLNNLKDISLEKDFAAIVGYTDADVDFYLKEHLHAFADERGESFAKTRELLRTWYNGYHFSEGPVSVYNPFSLHNCLSNKRLSNYWFSSGTPSFLLKFIERNPAIAREIIMVENGSIPSSKLDAFQLDDYYQNFKALLVQTGYLTIKTYNEDKSSYTLAYPNEEVRRSMTEQVLEYVGNISAEEINEYLYRFRQAVAASDVDLFCQHFALFLKLIPHTVRVNREKFYHGVLFIICKLLGFQVVVEMATEIGYTDAVLKMPKLTCVVELKKDKSPDVALKQIEKKKYFEVFTIDDKKPVVLCGISFYIGKDKRVGVKWMTKKPRKSANPTIARSRHRGGGKET